jgi:AmmeMemoRadiSam system protein B
MRREEGDFVVLHDPLGVSEPVAVDADFGPVLDLLTGQRTLAQIRQSLMMRGDSLEVAIEDLEAFVSDLSESGLLDDAPFRARWATAHKAFLASPTLPANAAGILYPKDPSEFERLVAGDGAATAKDSALRAVWLPCEPIELTGPFLRDLLRDFPGPAEVDVIVLLAADGQQGMLPYAITDKSHVTPFGPTRGDAALVAHLEGELPWVRREEIRHRRNDGLELAASLVKCIYGDACPPTLPVCCGPSSLDLKNNESEEFFDTLELALMRKRALFVACASLSHCGPAYGETDYDGELQRDDDSLCLDAFLRMAPSTFLRRVMQSPTRRARGAAPAYALSRLLDPDDHAELAFYQVFEPPSRGPEEPEADASVTRAGGIGCAGVRVSSGVPRG